MNLGGWLILILAVGGVIVWVVGCFVKVFSASDTSHLTAEPTIELPDAEQDKQEYKNTHHSHKKQ